MRFPILRFEVKFSRYNHGFDIEVRMRSKILRFLTTLINPIQSKVWNYVKEQEGPLWPGMMTDILNLSEDKL